MQCVLLLLLFIISCSQGNKDNFASITSSDMVTLDNLIFIGSRGNGLFIFNTKNYEFSHHTLPDTYANYIHALGVDNQKRIWISTDVGMYIFDNNKFNRIENFPTGFAKHIVTDKYNNIWFTGFVAGADIAGHRIDKGTGLYKFDGKEFEQYMPFSIVGFTAIAIDRSDNLWAGGSVNGKAYLLKFNGNEWSIFDAEKLNLTHFNGIYSISVDYNNNIWIGGTERDGIIRFDGKNAKVFSKENSNLPINRADEIIYDERGNMWFILYDAQTNECILAKYNANSFSLYLKENFISKYFTSLAVDVDKNLWISDVEGLIKWDGSIFTYYKIPVK